MNQKQRLFVYEQFMHKISIHCTTMNTKKIQEAVSLIDQWSYAHRQGNGELSPHQQQALIDHVVKLMEEF